ncbi:MAG TPA: MtrB/PioB family decaheme-associated outer membrane protein [Candidatus Methylomirabilis sp.]|nr:MtrB/PioB family decaheme-associated outer membrane protein [Candidatus Methylomirabilis sp.]
MDISKQLLLLFALSAPTAAAVAADSAGLGAQPLVDTSQWLCKYCTFEKGWSGTVDLGATYVSEDSFKFGEYTGLNKKGAYFLGDGSARFRGEDANYWNIEATDLGLDSRSVSLEGGQQGAVTLFLNYKELPHFISDSAVTPYFGTGSRSLTLPTGWVPAGTTGGMSALPGSLHEVDLETKRTRIGMGVSLIPATNWRYSLNFREETKEGTQRVAGTFFFNSAQLVMPVDYVTDQIDASASYSGRQLQAKFAYYGSTFNNKNQSLTWQNAYTPLLGGATEGQLALPPDNQFHQLLASLGYQFSEKTRGTADIAFGRMTQDDPFLPPTLNASLGAPNPPRDSLAGKVDTTNASLKLVSAVTGQMQLNAAYTYNDRNNKTPQAAYVWVTTDSFVNAPRTNLPYSFTQNTIKLSADYRFTPRLKTSVGYDHDTHERTFQETDKTREDTYWARLIARSRENIDLTFKLSHAQRDQSNYVPVPEITPPENPLLVKYYMANRTRDSAGIRVDVAATDSVTVGLGADVSRDDYPDSALGLTNGSDFVLSADVSAMLTKKTSLHFFLNHEEIDSKQAGSQSFSTADWFAENNDKIDVFGVGVKHSVLENKLDVGADYTTSRSTGAINLDTGTPTATFPDLVTLLDSVKLYATYHLKDNISLHGAYWYERYDSKNWMLDGVTPSTIPNVLAFGEQPPSYHVNVISLSMRYKF